MTEKQKELIKNMISRRQEEIKKKKYSKKLEASKFLLEHEKKIKEKKVK